MTLTKEQENFKRYRRIASFEVVNQFLVPLETVKDIEFEIHKHQ